MFTLQPPVALQELTVVADFCEVYLAKEGHRGVVGINYLRKIELPIPFGCLGAMLAGVDYVLLVGAGSPAELPELLRRLARRDGVALSVRTQGTTGADGTFAVRCSPRALLGAGTAAAPAEAARDRRVHRSCCRPGHQPGDPTGRIRHRRPDGGWPQRAAAGTAADHPQR